MLWVFTTESKQYPILIICVILTTLKNEQHPRKSVRFDEYGALENSIYVTKILIDEFSISIETTGGDASLINGNNEIHNIIINNMVI